MFGLVEWRGAGERCGAREKRLDGVRFLAVGIRRGDGLRAVWSLRTAARTLERYGVTQAVFPRGFSLYERFAARGIVPVDVRPLREAAAAAIARRVMAQQEIAPRRATVALCAARVTRAYAAAAETYAARGIVLPLGAASLRVTYGDERAEKCGEEPEQLLAAWYASLALRAEEICVKRVAWDQSANIGVER